MKHVNNTAVVFRVTLLLSILLSGLLSGADDSIVLPGRVENFISYLRYHSMESNRFLFHLNEILLFEELPDVKKIRKNLSRRVSPSRRTRDVIIMSRIHYKRMMKRTQTYNLKIILDSHRQFKKWMRQNNMTLDSPVSLSVYNPEHKEHFFKISKLLGFEIVKGVKKRFRLIERYSSDDYVTNHYYYILGIDLIKMEREMNRSGKLVFTPREFRVQLPMPVDFFREVTGLDLTPENFVETLVADRNLQLLTGILCRLSYREIEYVRNLGNGRISNPWQAIYRDDQFLRGFFLLSHALRVQENKISLPGGENAKPFWEKMTGMRIDNEPFRFIKEVATRHYGKLNYFYIFSFFLPKEKQDAFMYKMDNETFRELYSAMELDEDERIDHINIPALQNNNLFLLMYTMETKNGNLYFPGGIETWAHAIGAGNKTPGGIMKRLLTGGKKNTLLKRFTALYSKFRNRPGLLTPDNLKLMFDNYLDYNVVIDYIERLPIEKPGTVKKIFDFVFRLEKSNLGHRDKQAITAIVQSLLTLMARRSEVMPAEYDYESMAEKLTAAPLRPDLFYDEIVRFMEEDMGIEQDQSSVDRGFMDFLVPSGEKDDRELMLHGQIFKIDAKSILEKKYAEILRSQETGSMSALVRINGLLRRASEGGAVARDKLMDSFIKLPIPDDDADIPARVKGMFQSYSGSWLFKRINHLAKACRARTAVKRQGNEKANKIIRELKGKCLLHELKHIMVTSVYAVVLKNPRVKVFLNPNLTRFHDFSYGRNSTPWNHSTVRSEFGGGEIFHVSGGLSRIEIPLSYLYCTYLFGREEFGRYSSQAIAIIFNNNTLFPLSPIGSAQEYTGAMIKLAEELLEQSGKNPELAKELGEVIPNIISGNHYHRFMNLMGKRFRGNERYKAEPAKDKQETGVAYYADQLYFGELLRIGEHFFHNRRFPAGFSRQKEIERFFDPAVLENARRDMERLGTMYYHTFGSLKPRRMSLFPQSMSRLFKSRWLGAEMIDELKIKGAYISYLRNVPRQLLGILLYRFIHNTATDFAHNFSNDYHKTYFLYSLYNYLYMNRILKTMQRMGVVVVQ